MSSPEVMEILVTAKASQHGCSREVAKDTAFSGCGLLDCPDCLTAKYLQDLVRAGCSISSATIVHDPSGQKVVDSFDYGYLGKRDPSKSRTDRKRNKRWDDDWMKK